MTAKEIVNWLDLRPHPEGGFYRETFRDSAGPSGRAHSTAIYYLLRTQIRCLVLENGRSSFMVDRWLYDGGCRPDRVVADAPAASHTHARRACTTLSGWTVAPGFEFSGFEVAKEGWTPG